ncbi:HAD family hydrolase [Salinithrix halophila]|uniref:HAD family hydrolase n=1 Tax=Salinithrix halophila TaxID=1485204 RepID=A0ABV8JLF2_9BACL
MIKLVVSDLDGTLLDQGQKIREEDQKALKAAKDRGADICLASGRMQEEFTPVMETLGIPCHGVSQNGSFVRTKRNESLHVSSFPLELTQELHDQTIGWDVFMIVCFENNLFVEEEHPYGEIVRSRLFAPIETLPDIRKRYGREFLPCKFSYFGEMDTIKKLKAEVDFRFPGQIDTFISDKDCLDIMPAGVSKGHGLQVLVKHLGLQPKEVMCVGDAFNDVSMFDAFPDNSIAMAHAPEGVRKKARCKADSVADALRLAEQLDRERKCIVPMK